MKMMERYRKQARMEWSPFNLEQVGLETPEWLETRIEKRKRKGDGISI